MREGQGGLVVGADDVEAGVDGALHDAALHDGAAVHLTKEKAGLSNLKLSLGKIFKRN